MFVGLFKKIFGTRNDRLIKRYKKIVKQINQLEQNLTQLSDESLQHKTQEFKKRYANGETLEQLLPEAFAVCREASRRVMNMRHFDVQLIGGIALHEGKIAEMRTGEGKTLVGTLAAYLNALSGKGVHVVTVNDYLAQRDAKWMSKLYNFLGLSVGINLPNLPSEQKKAAYNSDITYSTNNELGFDYLRNNMVYHANDRSQRALNFAIIDEVDSILVDEARTPLIISGMAEDYTDLYQRLNGLPALLEKQIGEEKIDGTGVEKPGDFIIDEKSKQIFLTETGHEKSEEVLQQWGLLNEGDSLYAPQNIGLMHHVYAALRAHYLYTKDQQYVVQNNEVLIVDEFTGRLMAGRRWSEGLHQALEAKEGVEIQAENQTMASITFQNYFRMYGKICGMTGTANTEAYEFQEIYGLEVVMIPTNRMIQRKDFQDQIYKTTAEKYRAIIKDVHRCYQQKQPVLIGTASIETSEYLSELLSKESLPHQVLNAKQHEREAEIIAQAGKPSMVTIATNMAGRGTDIVLGGNIEKQLNILEEDENLPPEQREKMLQKLKQEWQKTHEDVKALGGLHIIGTERHESRRIDNQLRGRSGRQGDKGSSRFYLSLDDDLMRIFGGERLQGIFTKLNMPQDEPIESSMVSRSIESAQRKVEARNFDMRKQLLEYDDVANEQRREIYALRDDILFSNDLSIQIDKLTQDVVEDLVRRYVPENSLEEQWRIDDLQQALLKDWQLAIDLKNMVEQATSIEDTQIVENVMLAFKTEYMRKKELVGEESFHQFEKTVVLSSIDKHWREHLMHLDHLRQGISLRGFAQKDPKQEYKRESFEMFGQLLQTVKENIIQTILSVKIQSEAPTTQIPEIPDLSAIGNKNTQEINQNLQIDVEPPASRNALCPCGSGLRYKHCHGKLG